MLWSRENFHTAYDQIKRDAIKVGGCTILMIIAMDVDALCASEILTNLFKADFLSYTLIAVNGYDDIIEVRNTHLYTADNHGNLRLRNTELKSIVMVNCGAIVNLTETLALPKHINCYVFDSHRPIHLTNIYDAHNQIVVFDDEGQSKDLFPADGSDLEDDILDESDDESDEQSNSDIDEEDEVEQEEDDEERTAEIEGENEWGVSDSEERSITEDKENMEPNAEGIDEPINGSSSDVDVQSKISTSEKDVEMTDQSEVKSRHEMAVEADPEDNVKLSKRKRRMELHRYYRDSFYGAPASVIAFELASQLNNSRRELLWLAIIGLTKQFVMEEIDHDNYNLMVHRFQDEVFSMESNSGRTDNSQGLSNPADEHGRITFEEEFKFMCYRHWSLYESMYYSDYIASSMGLYVDAARRKQMATIQSSSYSSNTATNSDTLLHVFLARIGFSLQQAQQQFAYMPLELKRQLRTKVAEIAPLFGLDDLFYGSFTRQFAFQFHLCAADAYYSLQALLEAPTPYIQSVWQHLSETQRLENWITNESVLELQEYPGDTRNMQAPDNSENKNTELLLKKDKHLFDRQQNFRLAHGAIACESLQGRQAMERGIKVAMEIKKTLVRVGVTILERKLIQRVKHFRFAILQVPEHELELFANANILTQLALFLLNIHRASGKWGGALEKKKNDAKTGDNEDNMDHEEEEENINIQKPIVPLVLITRNPIENCFLVVGITCPNSPGEVQHNALGTAFKLAAKETGAEFRQDGFSTAMLSIQLDDVQLFVEQLHNVLDA